MKRSEKFNDNRLTRCLLNVYCVAPQSITSENASVNNKLPFLIITAVMKQEINLTNTEFII